MQIQLEKMFRLYLAKFMKAKATTGLPYAGLAFYYIMVYLLEYRWLRMARNIGELLQRIFGANYSVNSVLATVYSQMWNYKGECKALMRFVTDNNQDVDFLARAGESAAYAGDFVSLKRLRDIAALESLPLLHYLDGLLAFLIEEEDYRAHFKESVKAFFRFDEGSPSKVPEKAVSIMSKQYIESGRDLPSFVRQAYNISDLSRIDEQLIGDYLSPELISLPTVFDRTQITGLAHTSPIVLISCSDGYLNVFAEYYIRIFRRKNLNIIHFHVLAEDAEATRSLLVALKAKYSNILYSIETISGRSQTYITLVRFLICHDLIKHYNRDILISDIDVHFDFDLSLIGRELRAKTFDFGLYDLGYSVPWAKFAAGCSYFRVDNHASDVFLELLSRHLVSLYSDGGFFSMDQVGMLLIYEYMRARGDDFRMLNLYKVIDFKRLASVPKKLQRRKIKCKFGNGGPQ